MNEEMDNSSGCFFCKRKSLPLDKERIRSLIDRGVDALSSTGTTAPSCRIDKLTLLDLVNVSRAALEALDHEEAARATREVKRKKRRLAKIGTDR